MNEQEFITEVGVGERCLANGNNMLAALAWDRCRTYIAELYTENKDNPKIKELEVMLPRSYQRIPHV
jgi:hypothetical protein